MTPESGIMDGRRQNKVYRLLPFFSLGHFQLALPADFLFRHGARFSKDLESFRARRQILKSVIIAQFLAHKPVNFASLNVSFLVLF